MDNMKDKVKGFIKNPFSSSSSGKFKGQGRVLGSSSGPILNRLAQPKPNPTPTPKPPLQKLQNLDHPKPTPPTNPKPNPKPQEGFDPFDALITPRKRSYNDFTLNVFDCPICGQPFCSEHEVSVHVDTCVNTTTSDKNQSVSGSVEESLEACIGVFGNGRPGSGSVEAVVRLLRKILRYTMVYVHQNLKFDLSHSFDLLLEFYRRW